MARQCPARPSTGSRGSSAESAKTGGTLMGRHGRRVMAVLTTSSFLLFPGVPVRAAAPGTDGLVRSRVGKDWATNGGNLTTQRYPTLRQIDTTKVKQLKGAGMTRLKGSGNAGKYSFEASPLVKDGIMYVI